MTDQVLILNCGSSSIKAALFDRPGADVTPNLSALLEGIGTGPSLKLGPERIEAPGGAAATHEDLLDWFLALLADRAPGPVTLAGHRIVHGGLDFSAPCLLGEPEIAALTRLIPMARSHQPHNLAGVRATRTRWPAIPQAGCFDTAFHRTIPETRQQFPLPRRFREAGLRRYGFHGLSYEWIVRRLPQVTVRADGRVIAAHLGNGASLCGMIGRRSLTTTMGFTPLDGLVMGNRPGTLDPGAVLYLIDEMGLAVAEVRDLLFHGSGLRGVSALTNDMRSLLASSEPQARLAVDLFVESCCHQIGAAAADLKGLDALVFTGGIGENAVPIRARIAEGCAWLGARLDPQANEAGQTRISTPDSAIEMLVLPTNEEAVIAGHARALCPL
jgi:acetate kinase